MIVLLEMSPNFHSEKSSKIGQHMAKARRTKQCASFFDHPVYLVECHYCVLFIYSRFRIRVRVRIRFSVWLVSCYAHAFVLL